jgi:D-alanyl-D-alanine carboxypeptidase/D-alanyl-D-alanine-endopeptidase (penicillin-binding protein 4)
MSVVVGKDGKVLYGRKATARRAPASNEKLLVSMAILDSLGPDHRLATTASAKDFADGVVSSNLWIVGSGDPEVDQATMRELARELDEAGVKRVEGSVRGSTRGFSRDWWARGWKSYFPAQEVALPTALAFHRNTVQGRHIKDPERRAAVSLTQMLRDRGIRVAETPGMGSPPTGLDAIAAVDSDPLIAVLRRQNVPSDNWYAETMGKLLGATVSGPPGTISKGAEAIDDFAADHGATAINPYDSSGLSYDDRVTAGAMVRLLFWCDQQAWADDLRGALPAAGEGTLGDRLKGIDVRAKTGTLTGISALSGWVRSERSGEWVEFSILSKGMDKSTASNIEDRIVEIVANSVS